jgi:photosystem II stability/assembly factor-like uncharacterized protein
MKLSRTAGFSLLELLLVVLILGAISGSVSFMFIGGLRAWNAEEAHSELLHNNQGVMAQVSEALEQARYIISAGPMQVVFTRELGLAAGTEQGARLLRDAGASWEPFNGEAPQEIPSGTVVFDLMRLNDTTFLAAGSDGCVYRSGDAGRTWTAVSLGDSTEVRDIAAIDESTFYAATANKGDVYKSTDGGLTWTNTGELENAVTVRSLAAAADGTVWAGTDWTGTYNIFKTTDGGATWTGASVFPLPADTWVYRKPVDISNTSSQDVTDYQVRIVVDFVTGKMKLDFSDIRFRDGAGSDLPFWIEAQTPGVSAIVWVKVPQINAGSIVTIYMYYGNPAAVDASDITTTMELRYRRYDIPYEWTPKVTAISLVSADDDGAWVDLPYQFPYWREFQGQIYACSNGYLSFGDTYNNDSSPRARDFRRRAMIAPFWEDLRTDRSYGSITDPGLFVDEYSDHTVLTYYAISFEQWRAGPVRYRAELVFQAITYRNGDVKLSYQLIRNAGRMDPVAGVSKGNNTDYIDISDDVAQGSTFLFGIRQYVSPEPAAAFGEEEVLVTGSADVLTLCLAQGTLYAGTADGDVLYSTDGGTGWIQTADLTGAGFVHQLFADQTGTLYAGTEPGGIVFRTADSGTTWTQCALLPGADQVRAIDQTIEKRLVCGASPTGLVYTSADSGASWLPLPGITGVSAVYCLRPVLETVGFSWSGNKYQDTQDRNDMVLRTIGGKSKTIDNGFTSNLAFEYFNADMSPADTLTPFGISQIATVRVTAESSSGGVSVSDSVSITLRNRQ